MGLQHRVLLIGGWGFSEKIWQPLTIALSKSHSSIAKIETVDIVGWQHVESKIDALCETAKLSILQKKPLTKTIIVAWSLGGFKTLDYLLTIATANASSTHRDPNPMISRWCHGIIAVCVNHCFASTPSARAALRAMILACTTADRCQTMLQKFAEKAAFPHPRESLFPHPHRKETQNNKGSGIEALLEKQENKQLRRGLLLLQQTNLGSRLRKLGAVALNDQTASRSAKLANPVADLGVPIRLIYGRRDAILNNPDIANEHKKGEPNGNGNGNADIQVWQQWLRHQNAKIIEIDDGHLLPLFSSQRLVEQIEQIANGLKKTIRP